MKRDDVILPAVLILLVIIAMIVLAPFVFKRTTFAPDKSASPGQAVLVARCDVQPTPLLILNLLELYGTLILCRKWGFGKGATALAMVLVGTLVVVGGDLLLNFLYC